MLEIFASDTRLTIGDVRVHATADEIIVQIANSRFTTPLASATPDQLRHDASVAAECAAAWHRMCSALNTEAERRDAQQRAAADQAVRQAAGPPADNASDETPPADDPATAPPASPHPDVPAAPLEAGQPNEQQSPAAVTSVAPVTVPAEMNGERTPDIAELLGGVDGPPADPGQGAAS